MRLNFNPILEATKTVSMSSNANPVIGDVAEYTITIENKGNVDVSNLNLNDTFVGLAGASIQLNGGPTFQSATAGSSATTVKREMVPLPILRLLQSIRQLLIQEVSEIPLL